MSKEEQKKQAPKDGAHKEHGPKEGQKKQGGQPNSGRKPAGAPKKHSAADDVEVPAGPKVPPRLRVQFNEQVRKGIAEKFGITNPNAMPKLEKIVLNVNMGRHLEGSKLPPAVKTQVLETLVKVSGQRPVVIKAKKS